LGNKIRISHQMANVQQYLYIGSSGITISSQMQLLSVFNLTGNPQTLRILSDDLDQVLVPKDRSAICFCELHNFLDRDGPGSYFGDSELLTEEIQKKLDNLRISVMINDPFKLMVVDEGPTHVKICILSPGDFPSLYMLALTTQEQNLENFLQLPETVKQDLINLKGAIGLFSEINLCVDFGPYYLSFLSCRCTFSTMRRNGLQRIRTIDCLPKHSLQQYKK